MKRSEINHLRRLLGWVRCDIGQAPADMQATMIDIADKLDNPPIDDAAKGRLVEGYRRAEAVPQYVRDAVKALEKALAGGGHLDAPNQPESRANACAGGGLLVDKSAHLQDSSVDKTLDMQRPPSIPRHIDRQISTYGYASRRPDADGIARAYADLVRSISALSAGREAGVQEARATAESRANPGFSPGAGAGRELPEDWPDDVEMERGLAEIGVTVWGQRGEDWLAGAHYAARLLGYSLPEAASSALPSRHIPASLPTLRQDDTGGPAAAHRDAGVAGAPQSRRSSEKLQAMQEDVALDPMAGCSTIAARPRLDPETLYLGCSRMGLAGASDEEVLRYVRVATARASTSSESDQADDSDRRARNAALQDAYDALQALFIEALKARVPGEPEDLDDNDQKFNIGQCGMAAGLTRGQAAIRALMRNSQEPRSHSKGAA